MTPTEYNLREITAGELTSEHLAELVRYFQRGHGLTVDGKAGPATRAALMNARVPAEPEALHVAGGWLHGQGVERIPAASSWYGTTMLRGPLAIVAHYTATDPGTALSLVGRRFLSAGTIRERLAAAAAAKLGQHSTTVVLPNGKEIEVHGVPRNASWHITIAQDGTVYQMVPLTSQAWHVASSNPVGRGLPRANECAIGIELEGHGDRFPALQVAAACRVWRALVAAYQIPRELAMVTHAELQDNRSDPGPVWMRDHAQWVLDAAYR